MNVEEPPAPEPSWRNPGGCVVVVRPVGDIDLQAAGALRAELLDSCREACDHVLVDLSAVDTIGAAGLGVLVGALRRAREHGKTLTLAAPNRQVLRALRITGLDLVFQWDTCNGETGHDK